MSAALLPEVAEQLLAHVTGARWFGGKGRRAVVVGHTPLPWLTPVAGPLDAASGRTVLVRRISGRRDGRPASSRATTVPSSTMPEAGACSPRAASSGKEPVTLRAVEDSSRTRPGRA